ncbi:MAG: hypothetical protein HQL64_13790 [Magnetococcales bacterium]|nr:hypothetical protein [Magnetococcales bacterium]
MITDASLERAILLVDRWVHRHGNAAHLFACHAALPLTLTVDLAHRIHSRFALDIAGYPMNIPWYTVGDLLLSPLVQEVGGGLYQMSPPVRDVLLEHMEDHGRLGRERLKELADFMIAYAEGGFQSALGNKGLQQGLIWTALAYTRPQDVVGKIATQIKSLLKEDLVELVRVLRQTVALSNRLSQHQDLVEFAAGLLAWQQGDMESASQKLAGPLQREGRIVRIAGVPIELPERLIREVVITPIGESLESIRIYTLPGQPPKGISREFKPWPAGRVLPVQVALWIMNNNIKNMQKENNQALPPEVKLWHINSHDRLIHDLSAYEWLVLVVDFDKEEQLALAAKAVTKVKNLRIKTLLMDGREEPEYYESIPGGDEEAHQTMRENYQKKYEFIAYNTAWEKVFIDVQPDFVSTPTWGTLNDRLDALWDLMTPAGPSPLGANDLLNFSSHNRYVRMARYTGKLEDVVYLLKIIRTSGDSGIVPSAIVKIIAPNQTSLVELKQILDFLKKQFANLRWSFSTRQESAEFWQVSLIMEGLAKPEQTRNAA